MAISGIIFENQVLTAKGLRSGFQASLSDGIISGCDITYSGSTLTIAHGVMVVCGGIFSISGSQSLSISGTSGVARVKAVVDISQTSTTEQFNQVSFVIDQAASESLLPALVQENINAGSGQIYQAAICTVSLGSGGITGVLKTYASCPKLQYGDTLPDDAPEGTIFLLKAD